MKNDLLEMGFSLDKIIIHHLEIDTKQFKLSQRRKNHHINFLVVALFNENKGIEYEIHTLKKLIKIDYPKYSRVRLKLIGSGPIEDNLKE